MEKTKSEVLGGLYTIRGGLSLISMATDEIDKSEQELVKLDRDIAQKKNSLDWEEERITRLVEDKNRGRMSESEKNKIKKSARESAKRTVNDNKFSTFWVKRWILAIILCAVITVPLVALTNENFVAGLYEIVTFGRPLKLILAIFLSIVLWAVILGIVNLFIYCISYSINKRDEMKSAVNSYQDINTRIDETKIDLRKLEADVRSMERERKALVARNEQIKYEVSEKTKMIKLALNKEYDGWLHESDWENVDLLIYYIETNRAESVKEALQLVDQQRRAEQLEATIRQVGTEIVGTIHSAFERMGEVLVGCFTVLSNQLAQMETNLMNQSERMIKSTEMQTALMVKSGKTCADLLKDMKRNLKR